MKKINSKFSGVELLSVKPINDLVTEATIRVCWVGDSENRNKTIIPKSVGDQLYATLPGAPVVGYFNKDTKDFEEHSRRIIFEKGDMIVEDLTQPYGFVSPTDSPWYAEVEEDGIIRNFLHCKAYLWTRQYEAANIGLKKGQSMELYEPTIEGFWRGDTFVFTHAEIDRLCILGDEFEPCFKGASVFTNEKEAKQKEYKKFTESLEEILERRYIVVDDKLVPKEPESTYSTENTETPEVETVTEDFEREVEKVNEEVAENINVEPEQNIEETTEDIVEEVAEETESTVESDNSTKDQVLEEVKKTEEVEVTDKTIVQDDVETEIVVETDAIAEEVTKLAETTETTEMTEENEFVEPTEIESSESSEATGSSEFALNLGWGGQLEDIIFRQMEERGMTSEYQFHEIYMEGSEIFAIISSRLTGEFYKFPVVISNDTAELSLEGTPVSMVWLPKIVVTEGKTESIDGESAVDSDMAVNMNVSNEFALSQKSLEDKIIALETELAQYRAKELEQLNAQKLEVITSYAALLPEDVISIFKEKKDEYSLSDLEAQLALQYVKTSQVITKKSKAQYQLNIGEFQATSQEPELPAFMKRAIELDKQKY